MTRLQAVDKTLEHYDTYEKTTKEDPNFTCLLEAMLATMANANQTYTREAAISDGVGTIFAGTDTTSTALTFTLSEIFSSPQAYERLHQELKQAMPDPRDICPLSELEALPYLMACVKV
jgi:cytochrome P450